VVLTGGMNHLPESGLRITRDAARGALNSALLSKGSWGTTFLTLLHLLTLRSHALRRTLLLLHVAAVLLRELLLLVGIVLERHLD